MRAFVATALLLSTVVTSTASADLVFPAIDRWYFVGTTHELVMIRAGLAHLTGYGAAAWTFPGAESAPAQFLSDPPYQLGDVDCLWSYYQPNQGPFDGSEDYLGMSTWVVVDGDPVGVEIPELSELVHSEDPAWPRECYGYLFHAWCGDSFSAFYNCGGPPYWL